MEEIYEGQKWNIYIKYEKPSEQTKCCFFNVSYDHEERAVMLAVIKTMDDNDLFLC